MFRKLSGGNVIDGASQDSRAVLAHQNYLPFLPYLPLLVKQHNPQEHSLFKIKCQKTSVFIRVPLGHFIYGPAFG